MCGIEYVLKQFTLDFQVGPVYQNCLYLSRSSLSVQVLDFPATLVFIFAVLKVLLELIFQQPVFPSPCIFLS